MIALLCYSKENQSIVIAAVCAFIIFVLCIISSISKKGFHKLWPFLWGGLLVYILIMFFSLLIENEKKSTNSDIISLTNSDLIICFNVFGVIATIAGLYIAYKQSKKANDQIDGYDELYDAMMELLEYKKPKYFQFSFSTPIPGHISYGSKDEITEFKGALGKWNSIYTKEQMNILLPNNLNESYRPYLNKRINNKLFDKEKIQTLIHEDETFIKSIETHVEQVKSVEFFDILYMSNGKTAIYAVPLHYTELKDNVQSTSETNLIPRLIGFKTSDKDIVRGLKEKFDKYWTKNETERGS